MAYALATDVASEFKDVTFSATTAVTDDDVDNFLDQASAYIDAALSSRYVVPITGAVSLVMLKMLCIWLVKARILSILSVKTPQDKTKQDPDGPSIMKQAMDMLTALKKGTLVLVDATTANTTGGMSSFLMNEEIDYDFKAGAQTDNW